MVSKVSKFCASLISVWLSCCRRATGPGAPRLGGVGREIVVLPIAKDIIGGRVEVVKAMLVAIIVVIVAGETEMRSISGQNKNSTKSS